MYNGMVIICVGIIYIRLFYFVLQYLIMSHVQVLSRLVDLCVIVLYLPHVFLSHLILV